MQTSKTPTVNSSPFLLRYQWVLFDADDTLFHFDAYRGLVLMFSKYDQYFSKWDYQIYQKTNKSLWVDYQNGLIHASQLQEQRFEIWAKKLAVQPKELNSSFLAAMAEICTPMYGALSLLTTLYGNAKLGIITNGFFELQRVRLEKTGLKKYFDILVISEEVGRAKPHPAIFDHAVSLMGNPSRDQVLMVGDNLDSDIVGGLNAGFDTCWVNATAKPLPSGIKPTYQVTSLGELDRILKL